jgi:hypothetical protein
VPQTPHVTAVDPTPVFACAGGRTLHDRAVANRLRLGLLVAAGASLVAAVCCFATAAFAGAATLGCQDKVCPDHPDGVAWLDCQIPECRAEGLFALHAAYVLVAVTLLLAALGLLVPRLLRPAR